MSRIIKKDELKEWSNEILLKQTKDRAVTFHLYNKKFIQLCANDWMGYDAIGSYYFTHTDIIIEKKDVEFIEILWFFYTILLLWKQ